MRVIAQGQMTTDPDNTVTVRVPNQFSMMFLLKDANGIPMANMAYTSVVAGQARAGETDARGMTAQVLTGSSAQPVEIYIGSNPQNPADHGHVLIASAQSNQVINDVTEGRTDRLWKPWRISNAGITFMAIWESGVENGRNWRGQTVTDGLILRVYDDGYGIPTVAMGHAVTPSDQLSIGNTVSLERARQLTKDDLTIFENSVNQRIKLPLFPHEYDALVSILFNTGIYRRRSDPWPGTRAEYVAKFINKGKYDSPETYNLLRTFVANRVALRREREAQLFKTGSYNATH